MGGQDFFETYGVLAWVYLEIYMQMTFAPFEYIVFNAKMEKFV